MIEKLLFFLLILLIPSQLALHFWPTWSFVGGLPVDYLSPTLYFTDILIISQFILQKFQKPNTTPQPPPRLGGGTEGGGTTKLITIIFAVLNIFFSISPVVSIYKWLRLLEYFWLFRYLVKKNQYSIFSIQYSLPVAVVWSSFLAWTQFFLQRNVGGILFWLGERPLSPVLPGVAKISLGNLGLFLRPYATFGHPNALAGFLLVAMLIIYYLKPFNHRAIKPLINLSLILAGITIPVTFSRTAIFIEILMLAFWLLSKLKAQSIFYLLTFIILSSSFYRLSSNLGSPNSLSERITLSHTAILAIKQFPIIGSGLGTFIPAVNSLPTTYLTTHNPLLPTQPVNNIYLLLASELGLPAFLVISYLVLKNYLKIKNLKLKIPVLVIMMTGLVDHYWLTLHQNSLLLVLLLAIIRINSMNHER